MHAISERIHALMVKNGLSKADLSRASGIPYHRLNPWFVRDNAKPNAEDIEVIAKIFNVPIEHLLKGTQVENLSARDWILQVYDILPDTQRSQLEGFVRFLADEARHTRDSEPSDPAATQEDNQ